MPHLTPRRLLAMLLILLVGASMLPSTWSRFLTGGPRHLTRAAVTPMTHPLNLLAQRLRPARAPIREPITTPDLLLERDLLLQQVRRLQQDLTEANQTIAALSQVRDTLRLEGSQLIEAAVVSWSPDPTQPTITINRGKRHGITNGLVVATGFNLVGQVTDAGPITATVKLFTQPKPNDRIIVDIVPPDATSAPRRFTAELTHQGGGRFVGDGKGDGQVRVGDLAHLSDPTWPREARGFVVGTVTEVNKHPEEFLRRRFTVRPIRDLRRLTKVLVLVPVGTGSGSGSGGGG